ncbi:acyltransferase family protein [Microbacterium sp. F1-18]
MPSDTTAPAALTTARFGYNPSLDGLRAVAVVAVIVGHAGLPQLAGYHGVTVFFVISGYLITSLLMAEYARSQTIRFSHFFQRRFARLAPALVLAVTATVAWLLLVGSPAREWWAGPIGALTYTMNIIQAAFGNDAVSHYFQWSWSLSIEEQFYLVWPLAFLLLLRRNRYTLSFVILGVTVLLTWVIRASQTWAEASHEFVYYGPFSHLDGLALGAMIAFLLTRYPASTALHRVAVWTGPVGLVGLILLLRWHDGLPLVRNIDEAGFGQTAICATAVVFWIAAVPRGWFYKLMSFRPLVYLGRLSYGLYLWNVLTIAMFVWFVGREPLHTPLGVVWAIALVAVCWVSFRFVETPLRQRFAPRAAHAVLTPSDPVIK